MAFMKISVSNWIHMASILIKKTNIVNQSALLSVYDLYE